MNFKLPNLLPYTGAIGSLILGLGVGMAYGATAGIAVAAVSLSQCLITQYQHTMLTRQLEHMHLLRDHFVLLSTIATMGMDVEERLATIERKYQS